MYFFNVENNIFTPILYTKSIQLMNIHINLHYCKSRNKKSQPCIEPATFRLLAEAITTISRRLELNYVKCWWFLQGVDVSWNYSSWKTFFPVNFSLPIPSTVQHLLSCIFSLHKRPTPAGGIEPPSFALPIRYRSHYTVPAALDFPRDLNVYIWIASPSL